MTSCMGSRNHEMTIEKQNILIIILIALILFVCLFLQFDFVVDGTYLGLVLFRCHSELQEAALSLLYLTAIQNK